MGGCPPAKSRYPLSASAGPDLSASAGTDTLGIWPVHPTAIRIPQRVCAGLLTEMRACLEARG